MIYPCSLFKDFGRAARHVRISPKICCNQERQQAGAAAGHPNVNLQGAVLTRAKADEDTRWPEGFKPRAAGVIFD
jgi:hypothetical protein